MNTKHKKKFFFYCFKICPLKFGHKAFDIRKKKFFHYFQICFFKFGHKIFDIWIYLDSKIWNLILRFQQPFFPTVGICIGICWHHFIGGSQHWEFQRNLHNYPESKLCVLTSNATLFLQIMNREHVLCVSWSTLFKAFKIAKSELAKLKATGVINYGLISLWQSIYCLLGNMKMVIKTSMFF